jgi:Ca2+-binding RTX toxin-like protein
MGFPSQKSEPHSWAPRMFERRRDCGETAPLSMRFCGLYRLEPFVGRARGWLLVLLATAPNDGAQRVGNDMAKLTIGKGIEADMTTFGIEGFAIFESDDLTLTDTQFLVEAEDGFDQTYTGTGFVDNNADDIPDTGTLNSWENTFGGDEVFTLTGFSMAWEDYWDFVTAGDDQGFFSAVLGGKDKIIGNNKGDTLFGFDGNDTLIGGKGRDTLDGDSGRDKLTGGAAKDTLTGGGSSDTFIYTKISDSNEETGIDVIVDFQSGQDIIDLHKIDADPLTGTDDAFFLGGSTFTNSVGELIQAVFKDGRVHLQGDIDGNGFADFDIAFLGKLAPFTIDDFVF